MAGQHFQQQRGVFGRVGQRADLVEAAGERHQPVAADAAVGRLHPGHAAQAGRLADRAAGVAADRQGAMPAATQAAAPPLEPPGVRRGPRVARELKGRVLGRAAHGELVHVRAAEQHGVGGLELGDDRGVVRRAEVLQHPRGAGGRLAAVQSRSLTATGSPASRPTGLPCLRRWSMRSACSRAACESTRRKAPTRPSWGSI